MIYCNYYSENFMSRINILYFYKYYKNNINIMLVKTIFNILYNYTRIVEFS